MPEAGRQGSSTRQVLELARAHLGMDVAWVSRFTGGGQVFEEVVAAVPGTGPAPHSHEPLEGSYCVRVLDGRLPASVPDTRRDDRTRDLRVTEDLDIGSYVGVPIRSSDGAVQGMLCCISSDARTQVSEQDLSFLGGLAGLVADLDAMGDSEATREVDLQASWWKVKAATAGRGLRMVLQPVVNLATGTMYGVEALARFDGSPDTPDLWFADAARLGLRIELEAAAVRAALSRLDELPADVMLSINASPEVITSGALHGLLSSVDLTRVALEVTEHAAVSDYVALTNALAPYRAAGMRLSIDDAGAGYASFRHIVQLRPDIIKIDLSLIRDIDRDPVCQSLVTSLVAFATTTTALLIAEGVETQAELNMLARLGVPHAQGYLLARPADTLPDHDFSDYCHFVSDPLHAPSVGVTDLSPPAQTAAAASAVRAVDNRTA